MKKVLFYGNDNEFNDDDLEKLAKNLEADKLATSVYYIDSKNVTMIHQTDSGYWNSKVIVYGDDKGIRTIERIFKKTKEQIKFDDEGFRI